LKNQHKKINKESGRIKNMDSLSERSRFSY